MVVYEQKTGQNYDKIGGLLIVVAFSLIITPLKILTFLFNDSSVENWHKLTSPDSDLYHPCYTSALIFELVGNLVLLFFFILLIVMFFQKYKRFPKLVIVLLVLNIIFGIVDSFAIAMINGKVDFDKLPIPTTIVSILWIFYFLTSERVKKTFVKEKLKL